MFKQLIKNIVNRYQEYKARKDDIYVRLMDINRSNRG